VAGRRYLAAGGDLPTVRESQSHLNTDAGRKSPGGNGRAAR
jgi:Xaa-Pro aminopeptidase